MRAAIVQTFVPRDLAHGLDVAGEMTRRAAKDGASVVVFPETWLPGYPIWLDVCRDAALWDHAPVKAVFRRLAEQSVAVPSEACGRLAVIARENRVVVVMGISERVDEGTSRGTLFNSILTFDETGTLRNHHRKLVPTYTERMVWGNGDADGLATIDHGGVKVGALVCWEHWMPLARQAMHDAGEDLHAALWPTVHEMHQVASRHYAFEGRCYVLAAGSLMRARDLPAELEPHPAKVASPDTFVMRGGSAIIRPDGSYAVEPVYDREDILVADIDTGMIREQRMTLDVAGHYHRRDLLQLSVTRNTRCS